MSVLRKLPDPDSLFLYQNFSPKDPEKKTSTSVYIFEPGFPPIPGQITKNSLCFTFASTTSGRGNDKIPVMEFLINQSAFESVPIQFKADIKSPTGYKSVYTLRVPMSYLNDDVFINYLISIVEYHIDHYRSLHSFGCCSKYLQCSDVKHCVHENLLYSTGCGYRSNLENGRIFYGKNRNID